MLVPPQEQIDYILLSYRPFIANFLAQILRSADLFVDIGARYGFFSLLASTSNPELKIVATESDPDLYALLHHNTALLGNSNIEVTQISISNLNSCPKSGAEATAHEQGIPANCATPAHPVIHIGSITLDTLLLDRAPASLVIRICSHGSELSVIEGMTHTLQHILDLRLIIEIRPEGQIALTQRYEALLRRLDSLGYVVHLLDEEQRQFDRINQDANLKLVLTGEFAQLYCVRKEKSLSVCLVSHASGTTGAERILLELVDDLVAVQGAVCAVVLPSPGPLQNMLEQAGAACIIGFPYGWWCSNQGQIFPAEVKNRLLVENEKGLSTTVMPALRRLNPDVIWTQTMVVPWGAVFAAQLGKPHIWYVTEFGEKDFGFNFFSPLPMVVSDIMKSSDHVFVISTIVAETVFPVSCRNQVQILHCHVPPPTPAVLDDHRIFFVKSESVKLGIFGQIRTSKGQEDVVRAVAKLSSQGKNVELLVAGGGIPDDIRRLKNLVHTLGLEPIVRIPGFIDNPYPAMNACDILIVASRMEAFGRVGVEAMLLGKPVVFAAAGGLSEYLVDGQTGYSYAPGDVDGLAAQLDKLLDDAQGRRSMGDKGRSHALALFGKDNFSGEAYRAMQRLRARGRCASGMPDIVAKAMKAPPALPLPSHPAPGSRNDPCPCGSGKKFKRCHGRLS